MAAVDSVASAGAQTGTFGRQNVATAAIHTSSTIAAVHVQARSVVAAKGLALCHGRSQQQYDTRY
jgi:hypothetical protein